MSASEPITAHSVTSRELASRETDGVHVALHWYPREDAVTVEVADSRTGRCFELAVDRSQALLLPPIRIRRISEVWASVPPPSEIASLAEYPGD